MRCGFVLYVNHLWPFRKLGKQGAWFCLTAFHKMNNCTKSVCFKFPVKIGIIITGNLFMLRATIGLIGQFGLITKPEFTKIFPDTNK